MKKNMLLLYTFSFLKNLMFFGAVSVPFFLHRAGLDYTGMFILESVFSVSMIVFEIPTGVIADKLGRRISLFLGALTFGLSFYMIGMFPSLHVLIAAEVLCGLGMTMLSGADRALIYDILKDTGLAENSQTVFARYDGFATAGMLLAFPAGSYLVGSGIVPYNDALGLVFVATAAALVLAAGVILLVREPARIKTGLHPLRQGMDGFVFIFRKPALRMFSLNFAAVSSLTFFMFWFYQTLLMRGGFPIRFQGAVASAFNLSAALLLFLTPVIQKRISTKNMIFLKSIGPGILYPSIAFFSGLPMAFLSILRLTNLPMYRQPMLNSLMNENIESGNRATVLSGVSMIERILTAMLYPVAGILADVSPRFAFGVLGAITIVLSIILRVEEEKITDNS